MPAYTGFCREPSGLGTIWIDSVEAQSVEEAIEVAAKMCAQDWGCAADNVHVLGIAEGRVNLLHWEDLDDN